MAEKNEAETIDITKRKHKLISWLSVKLNVSKVETLEDL